MAPLVPGGKSQGGVCLRVGEVWKPVCEWEGGVGSNHD